MFQIFLYLFKLIISKIIALDNRMKIWGFADKIRCPLLMNAIIPKKLKSGTTPFNRTEFGKKYQPFIIEMNP